MDASLLLELKHFRLGLEPVVFVTCVHDLLLTLLGHNRLSTDVITVYMDTSQHTSVSYLSRLPI